MPRKVIKICHVGYEELARQVAKQLTGSHRPGSCSPDAYSPPTLRGYRMSTVSNTPPVSLPGSPTHPSMGRISCRGWQCPTDDFEWSKLEGDGRSSWGVLACCLARSAAVIVELWVGVTRSCCSRGGCMSSTPAYSLLSTWKIYHT